jgi:hypothetical protein
VKPFVPTLIVTLLATAAVAEERYDHRGSLGVLLAGSIERKDSANNTQPSDPSFKLGGWKGSLELGATMGVGSDGNDLKLSVRTMFGYPFDLGIFAGYRGYFSVGQWKTFFDLDLAGHITPLIAPHGTIGTRVAVGVQLDFLPIIGTYALLGGQIGFGDGLRYGAELTIGFQFRSYLLE